MKHIFFYTALIAFAINAKAQTNEHSLTNPTSTSVNNRWDLNKYAWSHTHYQTGKHDKPALDYDAIDNWKGIGPDNALSISRDGRYFVYGICRSNGWVDTLVVQAITGSWRQPFSKITPGFFSADSKQYIFQDKDELCFLELGTNEIRRIKDVGFFGQALTGKGEWLAYQLKTEGTIVLQNLVKGEEKRFTGASGFQFDKSGNWLIVTLGAGDLQLYHLGTAKELRFPPAAGYVLNADGTSMVLQTIQKAVEGTVTALHYVSLPSGEQQTIWASSDSTVSIIAYSPDDNSQQAVFTLQENKAGAYEPSIWYWKQGMNKAVMKVNYQSPGLDNGVTIAGPGIFRGKYILFQVQPRPEVLPTIKDPINVEVWSYKDTILQSREPFLQQDGPSQYLAALNVDNGLVIQLGRKNEAIQTYPKDGNFVVVAKLGSEINGDRFWDAGYNKDSVWLVSLKDASRRLLPIQRGSPADRLSQFWFSPGDHYLVYNDKEKACNYFSCNLKTGKIVNISAAVPAGQSGDPTPNCFGIVGWLERDGGLLVYDMYDIWQLDLTGERPAINITGGYGRANHTMLSLLNGDRGFGNPYVIHEKDTLLLRAFNEQTKYNGFYRKYMARAGAPERVYMGPCFMVGQSGLGTPDEGMKPVKAEAANVWIVQKQTPTEAPNYFVTTDFKTYRPLSNVQPHKNYNWLTSELVKFKQLDGTMSQGVLYKPENFDASKKYPVIISFYTQVSNRMYQYLPARYLNNPLLINNPAWMVSHGYLVFMPDMHFKQGQWGPSTVNTIDGAARYLKTLPYVDGERLGAAGHSNSGRFGFYLLTHSRSFAAMCVGEGTTNMVSAGLGVGHLYDGASMLEWAEQGAVGTGLGILWKNKSTWLDHSSVLSADKVTSPLLLFDNKDGLQKDQAAELFTALRRLDKKTWWVHYDHGGHALSYPLYLKDFTLRYTQFFDHYLKGAPAPRWMTQGIPYKYKGIESRYDLDPNGTCGDDCPVCKKNKAGK